MPTPFHVFARREIMPSWILNAVQSFLTGFVGAFVLNISSRTNVVLTASTDDALVALSIQGRWRYVERTLTRAHPGGSSGTYDIYATAADQNIVATPDPNTDATDYSFDLAIVASGRTPSGVAIFRKVATCQWSGSQITSITMLVGPASITPAQIGAATPTDVAAEATARGAADTTLQANIDAIVGVAGFGDGSDGALAFDGTSTVAGIVPASRIYTLTRDIYATSITLSGSAVIVTAGFRIFCTGTFNSTGGFIRNRGTQGTTSTGGAGGPAIGETTGSAGGDGGAAGTNTGRAGTNVANAQGGAGGAGGTGPGAGGAGGTVTRTQGGMVRSLMDLILRPSAVWLKGGAGGGGGTTSSSSASAGGGGGGGGVVVIVAKTITGTGQIDANGGIGGGVSGAGGSNGGSGGGGGGGMVVLVAQSMAGLTANVLAQGGASGGAGNGTGGAGAAGSDGLVLRFLIR